MKILITGGSGFIGSHLVEHFQGQADIHVLDNLRTGHRSNLEGFRCTFHEGSVLDRGLLDGVMKGVDVVFHLAALVSVPESVARPHETVEINVTGLLNVLESARHAGVRKLCFASSAAVYGENPLSPKTEDMTPDPRSPYAITKLDGEFYCDLYRREKWLETACLRFFNVFGPRQDPASPYAAAIPIFVRKALAGEPLTIFGDGEQTRDFIYVKDIVAALVHLARTPGATGVFNAGYGKSGTINEIARRILAETGSSSTIQHAPERAGDIRHSCAAVDRLAATGFRPTSSLEEGLAETIRYFRRLSAG
jgi:UDP-glucose 4-epimerase